MIIGVTGRKRAGKDTAAAHLCRAHGFMRLALADPLKEACRAVFGFTDEQLHGGDEAKEAPDPRWGVSARRALQLFGTDFVREALPRLAPELSVAEPLAAGSVWLARLVEAVRAAGPAARVVVSDVRFPDEAAALRALGGRIVRVTRPAVASADPAQPPAAPPPPPPPSRGRKGARAASAAAAAGPDVAAHSSETAGDAIEADFEIANDGSIEDLAARLEASLGLSAGDPVQAQALRVAGLREKKREALRRVAEVSAELTVAEGTLIDDLLAGERSVVVPQGPARAGEPAPCLAFQVREVVRWGTVGRANLTGTLAKGLHRVFQRDGIDTETCTKVALELAGYVWTHRPKRTVRVLATPAPAKLGRYEAGARKRAASRAEKRRRKRARADGAGDRTEDESGESGAGDSSHSGGSTDGGCSDSGDSGGDVGDDDDSLGEESACDSYGDDEARDGGDDEARDGGDDEASDGGDDEARDGGDDEDEAGDARE